MFLKLSLNNYSNDLDDVYEDNQKYNTKKKCKILFLEK